MFNKLMDPAYIIGSDLKFIDVNDAAIKKLGYSKDELLKMGPSDVDAELNLNIYREYVRKIKEEKEQSFETTHITKNGEEFPVEVHSTLLEGNEELSILSIARDISGRGKGQQRFRKLFNNLGDAILVYKTEEENYGDIIEVNTEAIKQTGYSKEELLNMNLIKDLAVGEGKILTDNYEEEGRVHFEQKKRKKDGSEYWTEVVGVPVNYRGIQAALSIQRNIQKRKEIEEREKFLHSLLRHDVKNKIQVIDGYLKLLNQCDLTNESKEYIEKATKAVDESKKIINQVRELREIEKEEIKPVDINKLIEKIIKETRSEAKPKNIQIKNQIPKIESTVQGGPLLKEVFYNLINNSIQHSQGTQIRIKLKEKEKEIICIIEDDGKGIPDKIKDKIFEKGYKDKTSSGTGIGLTLVKTAINKYNGQIEVEDSELGGAKFKLHLKKYN